MKLWVTGVCLILLLGSGSASARSFKTCSKYFKTYLNPLDVSSFLAVKGLDSEQITIRVRDSVFSVFYQSKPVFEFNLMLAFYDLVYSHTRHVAKSDANLNTGLGSVSYLLVARYLYLSKLTPLASDVQLSREAINVWERFVDQGYAVSHGSYYVFKWKFLEDSSQWKEIDKMLGNIEPNKSFLKNLSRYFHD